MISTCHGPPDNADRLLNILVVYQQKGYLG